MSRTGFISLDVISRYDSCLSSTIDFCHGLVNANYIFDRRAKLPTVMEVLLGIGWRTASVHHRKETRSRNNDEACSRIAREHRRREFHNDVSFATQAMQHHVPTSKHW